jgi:hypothetical protein
MTNAHLKLQTEKKIHRKNPILNNKIPDKKKEKRNKRVNYKQLKEKKELMNDERKTFNMLKYLRNRRCMDNKN